VTVTTAEEALVKLVIGDRAFCREIVGVHVDGYRADLDSGTTALMRLSALVAIGHTGPLLQEAVSDALDAGVGGDSVVGSLLALAPTLGVNQLVAAAPALAVALGYDLDASLESLDDGPSDGPSPATEPGTTRDPRYGGTS
jgi:alkylhydroperoxidase/carboxymuconolactone decarboxylase family protein YurZ